MVLKVGKAGVSSGNTLRMANTRYLNQYAVEACISVRERNGMNGTVAGKKATSDGKFLDCNNVFYSLNKKGRWRLPDIIKEEIECNLTDTQCKISLLELHKLQRQNNCVGYYTNKGHTKRVLPRKSTYLNRCSVTQVNEQPIKRRRRDRFMGRNRVDQEADDTQANQPQHELVYHVVYPTPMDSAMNFSNPKFIEHKIQQRGLLRSRSSLKCKHKMPQDDFIDERRDDVDDLFLEAVCEADELIPVQLDLVQHLSQNQTPCDFGQYFQKAMKGRKFSKYKSYKSKCKKHKKTKHNPIKQHIRYLEESYPPELGTGKTSISDAPIYAKLASTEIQPVEVYLPKTEIQHTYLKQHFNDNIIYPQCQRSKFIIDITKDVKNRLKKLDLFRKTIIQKLELTTFIVYNFKRSHNCSYDVYEVSLNFHTKLDRVSIETLFYEMTTNLAETIELTLAFMESLPPDTFYQKELEIQTSQIIEFKTIRPFIHLESKCFYPEELAKACFSSQTTEFLYFECVSIEEEKICNVCFEEITVDVSSTSLRECGHLFCNDCWREHLLNSFNSGLTYYTCPEYNCDKTVDIGTMITLVNIRDIQRSQSRNISSGVDRSPLQQWCPNKLCGRIIQSNEVQKDSGSVTICACGIEVCFLCRKGGHWPADCEQFEVYENKLNTFGEDMLRRDYNDVSKIIVKGKRCPNCKTFIEKNRGCPSMMCVCGTGFCWSCVTPWKDHLSSTQCYLAKDTEGTEKITIRHIDKRVFGRPDRSNLYLKAVENRELRHHKHIKRLQVSAENLKYRLKKNVRKRCKNSGESPESAVDSIDRVFGDIVNTIIELNYVVEYCFVILDCDNDKANPYLQNIKYATEKLMGISCNISQLIFDENCSHMDRTFTRISVLRYMAIINIRGLVSIIARYRKKSKSTGDV